jgi:hypothetical protein
MRHDLFDLRVGDERSVHARNPPAALHVQHVALAEQLFGALFAEDGAAVDLRRHLEGDAGREVGLDRAGDDVDRGALRCHDQVDAGGARHLRQPLDRAFDLLAGDHHQVGHLVDDDDDVRHRRQVDFLAFLDGAPVPVEACLTIIWMVSPFSRACGRGCCSRRYCARRGATSCDSALPSRAPPTSAPSRPSSGR